MAALVRASVAPMIKTLVLVLAVSLAGVGCGGKKVPAAAPAPAPAAGSGSSDGGSAAATTSACAAEGGSCVSKVADVACGTKSHDGGCPDPAAGYCCIR